MFKELTKAGANIIELNTVRKHVSDIKGGNLAKAIHPATLLTLMASDVIGNDMEMIASGPTVLDTTTKADATGHIEEIWRRKRVNRTEGNTQGQQAISQMQRMCCLFPIGDAARRWRIWRRSLGLSQNEDAAFEGDAKSALTSIVRTIKKEKRSVGRGDNGYVKGCACG